MLHCLVRHLHSYCVQSSILHVMGAISIWKEWNNLEMTCLCLVSWCCAGTCIASWRARHLRFSRDVNAWWSHCEGLRCVFQIHALLMANMVYSSWGKQYHERKICSVHAVNHIFRSVCICIWTFFLASLQWRCPANVVSCLCSWLAIAIGPKLSGCLSRTAYAQTFSDLMVWPVACTCNLFSSFSVCATCSSTSDSWDTITLHLVSVSEFIFCWPVTLVCVNKIKSKISQIFSKVFDTCSSAQKGVLDW